MTCAHFNHDQIYTQVKASFSPFGHPTQVNTSWVTSINLLLANEIEESRPSNVFFATCMYLRGNLLVWPPSLSPFASSTCVHLRQIAGPFDQGFKPHGTWVISSNSNSRGKALIFYLLIIMLSKQGSYGSWKTWKVLEYYCGIFQDWKVLEKSHWSWKVLEICLTRAKNMKCVEGSKENWHWELGSVGVNVNFRALEKSILVLEKPLEKILEICFWKKVRTLGKVFVIKCVALLTF